MKEQLFLTPSWQKGLDGSLEEVSILGVHIACSHSATSLKDSFLGATLPEIFPSHTLHQQQREQKPLWCRIFQRHCFLNVAGITSGGGLFALLFGLFKFIRQAVLQNLINLTRGGMRVNIMCACVLVCLWACVCGAWSFPFKWEKH